jgi:kumamolisin
LGGGYRQKDIDSFFASLHLSTPTITAVSVDQSANRPESDQITNGEVEGNIEVVGAIAPKAEIRVYFAPNTDTGFVDAITAATRDHVSVLSISWGQPEKNWKREALERMEVALGNAASLGITVVVAAGDGGVTDGVNDGEPHVDFPASSEWVLAVGGTKLIGERGSIRSEVVWNSGDFGTGGGVSAIFPLPDWQQRGADVPPRKNGGSGRGIPDVVANADPQTGYKLFINGAATVLGGTAMAAPFWAGLIALLDQGLPHDVGYINPRLYREIGPAKVLRPITEGNNGVGRVPGFEAGSGWSAVAGWGSPNGAMLLSWLQAHPN